MSNFQVNELIKEYIRKKDLDGLRGSVTTIIYRDRKFSTGDFKNSINYIVEVCGIKNLYQGFDTKQPLISKSVIDRKFTEDDFADAIYELKVNFCNERIEDVKNISRALYPEKKEKKENEVSQNRIAKVEVKSEKKQSGYQCKMKAKKKESVEVVKIVQGVATVAAVALVIAMIVKSVK